MLSDTRLQSIISTSRIAEAEIFYRAVPGLSLRDKADGAWVVSVSGSDQRVAPVPSTKPSEHSVLGFSMSDVDRVMAFLSSRGVTFERFDGFESHLADRDCGAPSQPPRITELHCDVRTRRMKRIASIRVREIVIENDKPFAAGLRNPVQAAVEPHVLGKIVVLDKIHPRERRRKYDLCSHR